MGRRGPAPTPTRLKTLKGNPGKRALNKDEPAPPVKAPPCPAELSQEAKVEWERICALLLPLGLLSELDQAALAAYCAVYARWREAERAVAEHGLLVKAPSGYPIQSPYLGIISTCLKQMRAYLQEFGLSPSSRSRVNGAGEQAPEADAFDELLARRRGRKTG